MLFDDLLEALHAQDARLDQLVVNDRDLAAGIAQRFDDGAGRFLAAAEVVRGHVRHHLRSRREAGDVGGEHRDAGVVRLLDGRSNGHRVAGREHDGGDLLDDEILDLVLLPGHVELAAHHQHVEAVLAGFFGHAVADLLEERIGQREDGERDGPPARRRLARRLRRRVGRGLVATAASSQEDCGRCQEMKDRGFHH